MSLFSLLNFDSMLSRQHQNLAGRNHFSRRALAPGCNPSRTAIMTGLRPTTNGVYENSHVWREALPDAVTMPQYFAKHGYTSRGGGKILHHGPSGSESADNPSFQEFFERIVYPRPKIREGAFGCFDWGRCPPKTCATPRRSSGPSVRWAGRTVHRFFSPLVSSCRTCRTSHHQKSSSAIPSTGS